ncbi:hypothetical protein [Polynucleobacter necessarius]|uniref:hypothetical protein n=1 Tax=Polynucleobacter necessarius TaxID=576610 RepID=UPI001E59CD1F|nr:hypothetical protein [Polynucleobacter necessarius]
MADAKTSLEDTLTLDPARSDAYVSLGNVLREMELPIELMLAYEKALWHAILFLVQQW